MTAEDIDDSEKPRELLEITPAEHAALRKNFTALRTDPTAEVIPVSAVSELFKLLGVSVSPELIEGMITEHTLTSQTTVSLEDVEWVFAEWKILTRLSLRGSQFSASTTTNKRSDAERIRKLLLPDANWRLVWSFFIMLCSLVHWTIVLQRDTDEGLHRPAVDYYVALDIIFSFVYAVDVYLWLATRNALLREGAVDAAMPVMRNGWFVVDVLSALPLDVILSLSGASTAAGVFSHLRLLRFPRVVAFWMHTHEHALTAGRIVFFFQVLPLWLLFYFLFGVITVCALVFKLIRDASGDYDIQFLQSVYFVIQTVTTVGYGDIPIRSPGEMWFCVFLVYFGLLINAVAIGRLVTQIQRTNAYVTREDKLREMLAVLQYFHLPVDLQTEILSFLEHSLWNDTANAYYGPMNRLPQSIRDTMLLQTRVDVLVHVPVFKNAPPAALNSLAAALLGVCYKPEEYISFSGDPHAGVRFVLFGFIARFDSKGQFVSIIKSGEYFGFEGVLALSDEVYSHKALSYCDVWLLPPSKLRGVLSRFPRFLTQFYREMPETQVGGDMSSSENLANQLRELAGDTLDRGHDLKALHQQLRALKRRLEGLLPTSGSARPPTSGNL